jgi:inner membrane protein
MDILTHIVSGLASGTVISSFSHKGTGYKVAILFTAAFGAALPDLDAISLWSGFDSTFGKLLRLNHSGKEIYFARYWYSHHGFLHSLFAGILITFILGTIILLIRKRGSRPASRNFIHSLNRQSLLLSGFLIAYTIHLLEDMPTPACTWGGVNFFWPLKAYTGGTGSVWWWNNYDIFLIACGIVILNTLVLTAGKIIRIRVWKITLPVFIAGFVLIVLQIRTRNYDFNYTGFTPRYNEFEMKSKEIQKEILGEKLYRIMDNLDNKIPFHF